MKFLFQIFVLAAEKEQIEKDGTELGIYLKEKNPQATGADYRIYDVYCHKELEGHVLLFDKIFQFGYRCGALRQLIYLGQKNKQNER